MSPVVTTKISGVCPKCRDSGIERCHRKGLLEFLFCPLFNYWPYRCRICDLRFFSDARIHTKKNGSA
jgi:hypothetical protein